MPKDNHTINLSTSNNKTKLIIAIIINSFIVIFEIILGVLIGSLALISDAIHNITDIASLVLSFVGEKISARPANSQKTYGYKKIEAIIAFINSSILLAIIIFILVEAVKHLFTPSEINGLSMLIVASIAFIGNGIATLILRNKEENLNMKSAWLHSMQDALFSLAVIIAATLIHYFNWSIIDPIISILVSLFLMKEAYSITKKSINMLLDSTPHDINFSEVKNSLLDSNNIVSVKDLHIWQADSQTKLMSAHVIVKNDVNKIKILKDLKKILYDKFEISHTTLQIFSESESNIVENCKHCN